MRPVPGICDRCGQRYNLTKLKSEYVKRARTNILVCPSCWDASHPQLDTELVKTNDKQSVPNSRSDQAELETSRSLYGWNPVGAEATGALDIALGHITATVTYE